MPALLPLDRIVKKLLIHAYACGDRAGDSNTWNVAGKTSEIQVNRDPSD